MLLLGSLIAISSNSWLSAWIGLEINLLSFIPLIRDYKNNLISREASLKYFLTQALASVILLISSLLIILKIKLNLLVDNSIFNYIIISTLLTKLGAAPFHFWFPRVIEGLNWINSLILITWQKVAPIILLFYQNCKFIIFRVIILSALIGTIGGINQTSLRKILAFSSINHISWILRALYYSEILWINYFLIYSFLTFRIIYLFNIFNISYINQLFSLHFNSKLLKFNFIINFLSLGGLPPFLGFLPKWNTIQILVLNENYLLIFIITVLTLIALYYYTRLTFSSLILNYTENKWNINMYINNIQFYNYNLISFLSILGLPIIFTFYSIY